MVAALLSAQTPPQPDTSYRNQLEQEIENYRALRQDRAKELADIEAELGTTAASLQKRITERN